MKKILGILVVLFALTAIVAKAEDLVLEKAPVFKGQDQILYLAAGEKCYVVKYQNGSFPAHTNFKGLADDIGRIYVWYIIPGTDTWEKVTTDMATEVSCTFTPEQKTGVSTKPTGPGVVEVPNVAPRPKTKPIYFSEFENARCEIPRTLIPKLQSTADTLNNCKDCMLIHYGGISLDRISDSCHISTDEKSPYFSLRAAPKNSNYKTLTGDAACQTALANCRDDNFQKWFVDHGVNPAQLQAVDQQSVFKYNAPAALNRGVIGVIISTKDLNGLGGVIHIEVENPACSTTPAKETEACTQPPIVMILIPRQTIVAPSPQVTPPPQVISPALKQHPCFRLKEDLPCYLITGGILGGGVGWGVSRIKTTVYGAKMVDGNTVSQGGNVTTSICGKDTKWACIAGGVSVGMFSTWIIHEAHDKYILNHPDKKGKDKVDVSIGGSPTKGGAQGNVTLKF